MSVYVGVSMWEFGRMIMCHMVADTDEELDEMARKIRVSRRWKQMSEERHGYNHYDICKSKRVLAVKYGAVALDEIEDEAYVLNRLAQRARARRNRA